MARSLGFALDVPNPRTIQNASTGKVQNMGPAVAIGDRPASGPYLVQVMIKEQNVGDKSG